MRIAATTVRRHWLMCRACLDVQTTSMRPWRGGGRGRQKKREKRLQKFQIRCGAAPLGGEQTDVQHGCYHLSVSPVSASSISSFGRSLRKSSIHSPLTDRGTLIEDAMFTMSLRLQLIDDSRVSDLNGNSVAPTMGETDTACSKTTRRVWSLESCGN